MWIYRYLRADRVEIDQGPFDTQEQAQKANDEHGALGAITTGAFEVADDYKLCQGEDDE